jgi:hypothetical protein
LKNSVNFYGERYGVVKTQSNVMVGRGKINMELMFMLMSISIMDIVVFNVRVRMIIVMHS